MPNVGSMTSNDNSLAANEESQRLAPDVTGYFNLEQTYLVLG